MFVCVRACVCVRIWEREREMCAFIAYMLWPKFAFQFSLIVLLTSHTIYTYVDPGRKCVTQKEVNRKVMAIEQNIV